MTLPPEVLAHLAGSEIRSNFIVEIATATPKRWTPYRGLTADGRRGLIIAGDFFAAANVTIPGIEQTDGAAPLRVTISVSNTDNDATELIADPAVMRAAVTIRKLYFLGVWDEHRAPTDVHEETWFEGFLGRPSSRGTTITLDCYADMGRRGKSPRTSSRSLLVAHQPLTPGTKLTLGTW